MKTTLVYFVLSGIIALSGYCQNAKTIISNSIDAIEFDAFEMSSKLQIYDQKGNVRMRTMVTSTKKFGNTTKILVKFTSPADVNGTTFLIHDHADKSADMWIYLPATRKTRRIAGRERSSSFMGSEFTNANMNTPNPDDFSHKLTGSEVINGRDCRIIESTCLNDQIQDENGFYKQLSYVDKENNLSYKVEYFDKNGKKLKTQLLSKYKKQPNGKYFCYNLEMKNDVNGRRSVIEIEKFQLGSAKGESEFSPSVLEN
jgi:hypothetical protein